MKKFLLVFVIAWAAVNVSSVSAQSTLDIQEKCSKATNNSFTALGFKPMENSQELGQCISSYESHYNKKFDKCFILIVSECFKKDESSKYHSLIDVFGNKEYALYIGSYTRNGVLASRHCFLGDIQFNMLNGLEFDKQTKKWDIVSDGYLKSLTEPFSDTVKEKFDSWVKPYMEE